MQYFIEDCLIMSLALQSVKVLTGIKRRELFWLMKMWHILPGLSVPSHKNRTKEEDIQKCSHGAEKAETICQLYLRGR